MEPMTDFPCISPDWVDFQELVLIWITRMEKLSDFSRSDWLTLTITAPCAEKYLPEVTSSLKWWKSCTSMTTAKRNEELKDEASSQSTEGWWCPRRGLDWAPLSLLGDRYIYNPTFTSYQQSCTDISCSRTLTTVWTLGNRKKNLLDADVMNRRWTRSLKGSFNKTLIRAAIKGNEVHYYSFFTVHTLHPSFPPLWRTDRPHYSRGWITVICPVNTGLGSLPAGSTRGCITHAHMLSTNILIGELNSSSEEPPDFLFPEFIFHSMRIRCVRPDRRDLTFQSPAKRNILKHELWS